MSLEQYSGDKISREALAQSINIHNTQRDLVRELYSLRKPVPPLITGAEVLQVMHRPDEISPLVKAITCYKKLLQKLKHVRTGR